MPWHLRPGVLITPAAFAAAATPTVTWNPADKNANISLSGGNLTATQTSGSPSYYDVQATLARTTGKYGYTVDPGTITVGSASSTAFGFASDNLTLTNYLGNNSGGNVGVGWFGDGSVWTNSAAALGGNAATDFSSASTLCTLMIDIDNKLLWVREGAGNWNNSGTANPATGVGGISLASITAGSWTTGMIPSLTLHGTNDVVTANFGASAMTLPVGFSSWDGSQTG